MKLYSSIFLALLMFASLLSCDAYPNTPSEVTTHEVIMQDVEFEDFTFDQDHFIEHEFNDFEFFDSYETPFVCNDVEATAIFYSDKNVFTHDVHSYQGIDKIIDSQIAFTKRIRSSNQDTYLKSVNHIFRDYEVIYQDSTERYVELTLLVNQSEVEKLFLLGMSYMELLYHRTE